MNDAEDKEEVSQRTAELLAESQNLHNQAPKINTEAQSALSRVRDLIEFLTNTEIDLAAMLENKRKSNGT